MKNMKKIKFLICIIIAGVLTSCNDYFDINKNTNQATAASAALILPQALTTTASVLNQFNSYGMQIGGYAANAGGYGGFNETVSYAYTPNNYSNLWSITYDNLNDYQFMINSTVGNDANIYYSAVAKIMKAHDYQLLVDAYNDIPYSDALLGANNLTPSYDNAATIYASLAGLLDEAIAEINKGESATIAPDAITANDVVFAGNMTSWKKLANTLKLKLMIRAKGKATFANTSFDAAGFLTADALINPVYRRDINKQNPAWESWAFTGGGTTGAKSWIPTTYVMDFYDGYKLSDPGRGKALYYQFPGTGTNRLGVEGEGIPKSPDGSFWYPGSARTQATAGAATGALKGPDAGYPLFTAAESYFLQAEAVVVGGFGVAGTAKALFESGIKASFTYLYTLPDKTVSGNPTADAATYITNNADARVQFDLATTTPEKVEAIITQKYIALNMVHSHEGWNEYRRTGYPTQSGNTAHSTFASFASQSSRADKLPSRIQYPTSEGQYNGGNLPTGISTFTSLIFWAK
ncbi:MAG: SusD/RagB family nutrient-binding outer membrane lipoprotein [Flavobacterium psychrophilum]|nr:MAG: SusD/RagB family nutrient-binding outer membrane lipoprotein [Flavobacterium psychrophilum]